jgi:hypothetical protein
MRASLALIAIAAVLIGGCGSNEIDTKRAEDLIAENVREEIGAEVKSVSCPTGVKAKKGDTFECTVTGSDGTTGKATVTQEDDEGNVKTSAPFVHVRDLEREIAGGIGGQIGASDVEVSCPEIIPGAKGDVVECDATSGEDKAVIEVTQTDGLGNVNYKVKQ